MLAMVKSTKSNFSSMLTVKELVDEIERDINLGRISPGAWLKQIDLARAYGVSRLIVRQVLERLTERGQVELLRNRGYRVREFDPDRLNNIVRIRGTLEVAAAEMVVGTLDEQSIARMSAFADAFSHAITHNTFIEQVKVNRAFHREMFRTCPNQELVDLIFDLRDRIPVGIQHEKYNTFTLQRSAQEHFKMIENLRTGDRAALVLLVKRHVLDSLLEKEIHYASRFPTLSLL